MDLQRRLGVHGLIAPNAFVIHLSATDFDRFESFLDALVRELEEAARGTPGPRTTYSSAR